MKRFQDSYEGEPLSATKENARNRAIRQGQVIAGPGLLSRVTSQGTVLSVASGSRSVRAPVIYPFQVSIRKDGSDWKAKVRVGTVNGTIPVAGNVETSGGTSIDATPAPEITLTSTNNLIVLGIKVDLETDTITRLTVENREDSDVDPIEDLGARTRIFFETIAVLAYTPTPEAWAISSQVRRNNLSYEWGTVYIAAT